MKNLFTTSILSATMLFANAQTTHERTVGDFIGIKASTSVDVIITQSDNNSVKIETGTNSTDQIKTEVKNGILEIYSDKPENENKVKIYVNAKNLSAIEATGAALIKSTNDIVTDKIKIASGGAGGIKISLKASDIDVTGSGAGNINLSGKTEKLTVDISGACSLKAYNLETTNAIISASGAASAKVTAKQSIEAKASGAGTITYKGDPVNKNIEISGAGSVKKSEGNLSVGITYDLDADADSTNKTKSKKKNTRNDFKYWEGFQFGVNGFMNSNNELSMPAPYDYLNLNYSRSVGFSFNFVEHNFHIYKNYINLVTGLGLEFNRYNFKQPIRLDPDAAGIAYTYDSINNYKKNKLKELYLNIPLILVFNSNNKGFDHSFHLGFGVIAGYKLSSRAKQVFTNNGNEYLMVRKDDYNLSPFKVSATVRAGYGGVTLYADYALNTLFEKNIGPALHPFSTGFSLTF